MEEPITALGLDDSEDDGLADLFSFGSSEHDGMTTATSSPPVVGKSPVTRTDSPDSFIEMLTAETNDALFLGGGGTEDHTTTTVSNTLQPFQHDQETQAILNWLDNDDDDPSEEIVFETTLTPPEPVVAIPEQQQPTVVALPPSFDTFAQAMESGEATMEQIRTLYCKEQTTIVLSNDTQRAELYCKMVTHKSVSETVSSSLADSFEQWKAGQLQSRDDNHNKFSHWMQQQPNLVRRIAQSTNKSEQECQQNLMDLILYHQQTLVQQQQQQKSKADQNNEEEEDLFHDVLLPPVATVILSANLPVTAASVVLGQLIPNFMPLLALSPETERWEAALSLHSEFYLLANYHLPLLVVHLDRYFPGWYWPKLPTHDQEDTASAVSMARNLKKQGQIPPSWLLSHLAGECGSEMLDIDVVLQLWDGVLTCQNNATRFFLTLAVLERQASSLLLLTGHELLAGLQKVWILDFITDENHEPDQKPWTEEWWPKAQFLQTATPESVLNRLKKVEDEAVKAALQQRQERAEAELQARLDAEAAAHQAAQEQKAEEARTRLSRARLVAFYRKHAPGKESNIDKIMETYQGRLEVLDMKLKAKYGEGFNPSLKAKANVPVQNKLLASMNQGFGGRKKAASDAIEAAMEKRKPNKVALTVTVEEVLPVLCWSKEARAARGADLRRARSNRHHKHLKFYLIDSRSEEAALGQGRFPTAVNLSPETMMDPEKLQQTEEMFESLRGAVHIVIMGEGFGALPTLYDQKLSPKLTEMMEQDESRTSMCALFFQKRGFCFVSILDGGFCAAHAWLIRQGVHRHLDAKEVLVDYNPEASLFGQLETLHNATAKEKAQRKMANLLESSLVSMTRRAAQIENIAKDQELRQGIRKTLFRRGESSDVAMDTSKQSVESDKSSRSSFRSTAKPEAAQAETQAVALNAFKGIAGNARNAWARFGKQQQENQTSGRPRFGRFIGRSNSKDQDDSDPNSNNKQG